MQARRPVLCSPCSFGFKNRQRANTDVLQVGVPSSHASNPVIIVKCGNCSRCDLDVVCEASYSGVLQPFAASWTCPHCQHLKLAAKHERTAWHSEIVNQHVASKVESPCRLLEVRLDAGQQGSAQRPGAITQGGSGSRVAASQVMLEAWNTGGCAD